MKFFGQQTHFLLLIIGTVASSAILFTACSDDETTYTPTTYTTYFTGTLVSSAHDYSIKGATLLLQASGVTNPTEAQITYKWGITDAQTQEMWGQTVRYICPDTTITCTIALSAGAYDSNSLSAKKTVTLIDSTFEKSIKFPDGTPQSTAFTDARDNQMYQYRTIGSHDWMTQNLNWAGTAALPVGKTYKNESEYGILFGRLYSWEEAVNATNPVCPAGWHLPANDEWADLGQALTGTAVTFEELWKDGGSNASADATINGAKIWTYNPTNAKKNTQGWNALPAGKASSANMFSDNGRYGYWWSATENKATTAFYRYIMYNNALFYQTYGDKTGLYLSVRCVRD